MLTIETSDCEGGLVISASGDIDMETSPRLRTAIKDAVKKKPGVLKLKLDAVPYIDSSGIAVLIEGMKWTQKKKVAYVLLSPSDGVRDVLQLSKLLDVFTVEEG